MSCFSLKGAADEWRATRAWVDACGAVDIEALEHEFGDASVWVTDTARHALSLSNLIFYLTRPTPCLARKRYGFKVGDDCVDTPGMLCAGQSAAKQPHERRLHWPGKQRAAGAVAS